MPTYVFACPKCHDEIELAMKISEYSVNPKPICAADGCDGQQTMVTQLQAAPVSFKGAGWTPKGDSYGPSTDMAVRKAAKRRGKS